MNRELLEQKIRESGLKKGFIAEKLGIERGCLRKKLIGESEFYASEVGILAELLKLTQEDIRLIFYPDRLIDA